MQPSRSAPVDFLLVAPDASVRSVASAPSSPPSSASLQPGPVSTQKQHQHTIQHGEGAPWALKPPPRRPSEHDGAGSSRSDSGVIAASHAVDLPIQDGPLSNSNSNGPRSFVVPLASLLESHPSMAGESSSDADSQKRGSQHGSDSAAATTTTPPPLAPLPSEEPTRFRHQHGDAGTLEPPQTCGTPPGALDDAPKGAAAHGTAPAITTPTGMRLRGIVLLHPCLEGEAAASSLAGLLGSSRVGRHILRSMLKVEVGEVFNRRAWYNPKHLTPEVLDLYARPLRARGWDRALIAACCQKRDSASAGKWCQVSRALGATCPCLVLTGVHDVIFPPTKAGCLAYQLGCGVSLLPECGHLSHEEAVPQLLDALVPFIRGALQ